MKALEIIITHVSKYLFVEKCEIHLITIYL